MNSQKIDLDNFYISIVKFNINYLSRKIKNKNEH